MSLTSSSGVSTTSSSSIGVGGGGAQQRRGRVTTNIAPTTVLVMDDNETNTRIMSDRQHDQQQQEGFLLSSPSKNNTTDNYINNNNNYELTTTYNNDISNPLVLKPIPVQSLAAVASSAAVTTPTTPNKQLTSSLGGGAGGGAGNGMNNNLTISNGNGTNNTGTITGPIRVAVVKRNWLGTGPFDYHWLNVDCCGIFCALLTYCLHCYGMYVVCFIIIPPWMSIKDTNTNLNALLLSSSASSMTTPTTTETNNTSNEYRNLSFFGLIHTLFFTTLTLLAVIAHFKAMTTDPGAVPPDAKPVIKPSIDNNDDKNNNIDNLDINTNNKTVRICRKCHTFKPQRAHHCSICKRCIIKMDHHCPWVNNCVGIGNHKYFLLFIFYTCITCMYSLSLIIIRFTTCVHSYHHHKHYHYKHVYKYTAADAAMEATDLSSGKTHCLDHPTQLLYILGLLVEAILFGMFTSCMIFDQADVIRTNISHIDRFKHGGGGTGGVNDKLSNTLSGVAEVFGLALSKVTSNSKNNKYKRSTSSTIVGRFLSIFSTTTNSKSMDGNDSDDDCGSELDSSIVLFDNNQQDSIERGNSSSIRQKRQKNQNQKHTVSFRFDWLSPFAKAVFPPSVRDEMMGFCRPCLPRRPASFYNDDNISNSNSTSTGSGTSTGTGGDFELAGANIINSPKSRTNTHRPIRNASEIL